MIKGNFLMVMKEREKYSNKPLTNEMNLRILKEEELHEMKIVKLQLL
jgi:hypothetical protein